MSCGCNKKSPMIKEEDNDLKKLIDDDFKNDIYLDISSDDENEYVNLEEELQYLNELDEEAIEFDKIINKDDYDENSIGNLLYDINFNDDNLILMDESDNYTYSMDFIPLNEYTTPINRIN
jgi:hypothetical protein